jgi:hypothetical protein
MEATKMGYRDLIRMLFYGVSKKNNKFEFTITIVTSSGNTFPDKI